MFGFCMDIIAVQSSYLANRTFYLAHSRNRQWWMAYIALIISIMACQFPVIRLLFLLIQLLKIENQYMLASESSDSFSASLPWIETRLSLKNMPFNIAFWLLGCQALKLANLYWHMLKFFHYGSPLVFHSCLYQLLES